MPCLQSDLYGGWVCSAIVLLCSIDWANNFQSSQLDIVVLVATVVRCYERVRLGPSVLLRSYVVVLTCAACSTLCLPFAVVLALRYKATHLSPKATSR